jgi:hypothetical protein
MQGPPGGPLLQQWVQAAEADSESSVQGRVSGSCVVVRWSGAVWAAARPDLKGPEPENAPEAGGRCPGSPCLDSLNLLINFTDSLTPARGNGSPGLCPGNAAEAGGRCLGPWNPVTPVLGPGTS